jgi:hypothetical protein
MYSECSPAIMSSMGLRISAGSSATTAFSMLA